MPSSPLAIAADLSPWLIVPFVLFLVLIATLPLMPSPVAGIWHRYYPYVSVAVGGAVAGYYAWRIPRGIEVVMHTGAEYVSFVALIGSLFVIAGGIHVRIRGEATPVENVVFLAAGAVIANVVGTTGASIVLIRPWIRMNKIRISAYHVVFFIFVVSNVGGALTPIGDPPLFLGYLRGIPFFWLLAHVVPAWLVTMGLILGAFYLFDRRSFLHLPRSIRHEVAAERETLGLDGVGNLVFLLVVIGAVFLPSRYFVREVVMVAAAAASYFTTAETIHHRNAFSFEPIKEVAFLFIGIFGAMIPALEYLSVHGPEFGFTHPVAYYLASGVLSSVLDNAPTYLNFLQLAETTAAAQHPAAFMGHVVGGLDSVHALLAVRPSYVVAISLGSVFFGAMTYIGNGPNFMVKSIAHAAGVHVPSFFGYIFRYGLPILLPILAFVGWAFL